MVIEDSKKVIFKDDKEGFIRIAYQTKKSVTWKADTETLVGRTLEEALALENLDWIQDAIQKSLGVNIKEADKLSLSDLHLKIFNRVKNKGFDKTKFALGLIASDPKAWSSPEYIVDGLTWLYSKLESEIVIVEKAENPESKVL